MQHSAKKRRKPVHKGGIGRGWTTLRHAMQGLSHRTNLLYMAQEKLKPMSIGWALGKRERERDREPTMLYKGTEHKGTEQVPIVFVFGKTTYAYMYHTYPLHSFLTMDPLSSSTSPMNASS